ncbi:MAG: hypothetical protein JRG89_22080 [Deltaproteobacteria bacterium]|nr:hypothetical protein [Deltaproteobacteria bacterium]MBW2722940.1 hypothetical protein [Deltaproteobacteria bacterium]
MKAPEIRLSVVAVAGLMLLGNTCRLMVFDPQDLLLHRDVMDPGTGRAAEIVPGAAWIRPGPDGKFETADDSILWWVSGDADLVVRAGISSFTGPFPPSHDLAGAPIAIAEPFASGISVPFVVAATDFAPADQLGTPVAPPSLAAAPVVVAAFGDLDGDGYIGVTLLDGDPLDAAIEEAELEPLGRVLAIAQGGQASGTLALQAGGPQGARLSVVVVAAAYAGPFDPGYMAGVVPDGPMVMTEMPFLPRTSPNRVLNVGPGGPGLTEPGGLLAVQIAAAFTPDPSTPGVRERFTIPTDGSAQTVSLVVGHSGALARFGLGLEPDPDQFATLPRRPLRPGLDQAGTRNVYEILTRLFVPDDGAGTPTELRVLPLDRLGNVADLSAPVAVTVTTSGPVHIVSPDTDADPHVETLVVADSRGAALFVDDGGGVFDDLNSDLLVVDDGIALVAIDVALPDPDVDNSGLVDSADLWAVALRDGQKLGDVEFDATFDLTGDGQIDDLDVAVVDAHLGTVVLIP